MTSASGETKISATGFMNIIDMLPYRVEQLFRESLRDSAMSSHETVWNWNLLFFSGKDFIRFLNSSLLWVLLEIRRVAGSSRYLFNLTVSTFSGCSLGFKIRWTIFQISFVFLTRFNASKVGPVFFAWKVV